MDFIKTKIISGILLLGIVVSLFVIKNNYNYDRLVLFYKNSISKKIETEIRYLPKQNLKDSEVAFCEELFLGPVNHQNYLFLEKGEFLNACFVKNEVLYIDFPESFLNVISADFSSDDISFLLEKNIFTNCKSIKSAFISVNGRKIYEFFKK